VRVLVTGGIGVLGRALLPLLEAAGHEISAPEPEELDLFDAGQVEAAIARAQGVYHLATHLPPRDHEGDRDAWRVNDRLRADASRLLVDAALAASVDVYVVPTVTFVYPDGDVDEDTPLEEVPAHLESALAAEREAARFAASGRRGIALRLGLLDGAGTGNDGPDPRYGATLHVDDAGRGLLAALSAPSDIYNVVRDGERVSNSRFKQATSWRPSR
jgi:2-alkyl-3-oxoalkanoate reductase